MSEPESSELRVAAQDLAARGWPVMPVKPHAKEPLTPKGVKDATTDERTILHWWDRWPDANLGVACGSPGPTVLDVDDLDAGRATLAKLADVQCPTAATARGRHLYFAGSDRGTIALGYGELRGRGSYVIAPPSTHPSGKVYVWLAPPAGRLPGVPELVAGDRKTAGAGEHEARPRIGHGERHDYLKDFTVRLVRSGITDTTTLERMLEVEFASVCDPQPPPAPDEFSKLAKWGVRSRIAQTERERREAGTATKADDFDMPQAPGPNATLAEHRQYVGKLGGWLPNDIAEVERHGARLADAMEIRLTNGLSIYFFHQGDIATRGVWAKAVIAGTNGIANPVLTLKDWQLALIYRSLCMLAAPPTAEREAEDHRDVLDEFVAMTRPLVGYRLTDGGSIFRLVEQLRGLQPWDPRDRNTQGMPTQIIDADDGARYLRAGELRDYFGYRNAGIPAAQFSGRMRMVGLERRSFHGREDAREGGAPRRTAHAVLYRLPEEP